MIPVPNKDMLVNKFVDVKLPTKRMLFGRLGAVAAGTLYSKDETFSVGMTPTEKADALIHAAENFESPKEEVKQEEVKQEEKSE